jgi:CheY-like chemotaxis protein
MDKTNHKKRILIVDDDAALVKTFRAMLTRRGYEVIEASHALPALFRAVDGAPDLIIADINMPNMNGIELIQQFKAHQDTQDIPVVVVTEVTTGKPAPACSIRLLPGQNPVDRVTQVCQGKRLEKHRIRLSG